MVDVNALYSELSRHIQKNEYEKVIKTANKVLHTNHNDVKAFHCKIVALIYLDRFDDVLTAFSKCPEFVRELTFEKSYALYRIGKVEEALSIIESSPDKNKLHFRELKAQICYRQEKFDESYELYKSLVKQTADEYDDERKTNFAANIANLVNYGQVIDISSIFPERSATESYETLFNIACFLMYLHKFSDAELYLADAERNCLESFDEDALQEEQDSELNVIKTQWACCKHFQKKESQALNIYRGILEKKPTNYGVIAVANNNILAANKNRNVFEHKKKMKVLQGEALVSKLTSLQKRVIDTNIHQINAMNAQSKDEALNICDKLKREHPENLEAVVLLKAAIFMKNKNLSEAIIVLEDHLNASTGSKLKMGLAMAQLYLNMGKYDKACETLKSLEKDMFHPGVVSALVTIMIALGDIAGASQILQSAVDWNKKNKKNTGELTALWEHAADLHLKRGQPKLAVHSLEELLKVNPNDFKVISKLIIAYSKFNPIKVYKFCDQIRSGFNLKPHLDVNYLETSSWMMGLKAIKKVAKDQSPGTPFLMKTSKCRNIKKKKRLPKNYDPLVPPDPERWLPRRERSNFKKKKDRRNKDIGKGSQGITSSSTSDQFDITKMAREGKDKNASSTVSHVSEDHKDFKPQQRKIQRKKKKGGKW